MSQWMQRIGRFSQDGFRLAKAVFPGNSKKGTTMKEIFLDQARNHNNSVASSMLLVDKEIGLVRYHGLIPYLQKQKLPQLSWFDSSKAIAPSRHHSHQPASGAPGAITVSTNTNSDTNSSASSNPANPATTQEPDQKTAQVAFMITSSMKQQLSLGMGYSTQQIKQMTPTQASLILHHNIPPEEMTDRLPKAEEEYEQQRAAKEIPKEEPQPPLGSSPLEGSSPQGTQTTNVSPSTLVPASTSNIAESGQSEGFQSENTLSVETWSDVTWFEIVETKLTKQGEQMQRVGLYRDRSEAELAMQTRREIATSRSDTTLTYELRVAEDLELS